MGLFRRVNMGLSRRLHWRLPQALTQPLFPFYDQAIVDYADQLRSAVIVDVGAGFNLPAVRSGAMSEEHILIGMDILESSLRKNRDVDCAVLADACKPWPYADNSLDLVISRSVVEHLPDNHAFTDEMYRALKPGGRCIHVLPGKNAPFSVLNRLLPNSWTKQLIKWVFPEESNELGFVAYYDHCSAPALQKLFEQKGFHIEELRLRYYQSAYFGIVFPLYFLSALYDWCVWKIGIKTLASQILIVARKPED